MTISTRRICFVLEGLNFHGGAHVATSRLMQVLSHQDCRVDVLTDSEPTEEIRQRFPAGEFKVAKLPLHNLRWCIRCILSKLCIGWYPVWTLDPDGSVRRWLEQHDVVSVQSELSKFRHMVSTLKGPVRKVQLIHTDYANWVNFKECGVRGPRCFRRVAARWDGWWYAHMDVIAVIGESNAEKMRRLMPKFADKIVAFHNLFCNEKKTHATKTIQHPVKLVSLTRVQTGAPKCCEWYLAAARALRESGVDFDWTIYGNGRSLDDMRRWILQDGLSECVHLPGYSRDVADALAEADLSVLLSAYEGMPNAIYESMLCGTPVFATDVGAVRDMIRDGETGWIVPVDVEALGLRLVDVIKNTDGLLKARENLRGYTYDNATAISEHLRILGVAN